MAVLDKELGAGLRLVEGDGGVWSSSEAAPACAPRDWRSEYERERERADAAEARCEELRTAELRTRTDAGSWKSRFKSCRRRLSDSHEEAKELRRAAKAAPSLRTAAWHLERVLGEAGTAPDGTGAVEALGKEVARLRELLAEPEAATDTTEQHPEEAQWDLPSPEEARQLRATIRGLRQQTARLNGEMAWRSRRLVEQDKLLQEEKERSEKIRETARSLSRENLSLHKEARILEEQAAKVRAVSDEAYRVRYALDLSVSAKEKLEARIVGLRAAGATLSKLPFDEAAFLRNALRRSRRQKGTIKSLSRENARLRKFVKGSRRRIETLQAQLARLRSTGTVLSKKLYGCKSERQDKPGTGRPRGQRRGAPGHGRTQRPGLEERPEERNPPADACICGQCGQPYAPNGAEESSLIEIEVKAHKRVIHRPRWRRTCECASSPGEVSAPPAPRLFPRTLYGISFWARFLYEHCACLRPVHRVAAWFSNQGVPVSPGTLADSLKRFAPLFEPLFEAILAHQNNSGLRHADETSWRVQELRCQDRSNRAWMWTSVSGDAVCFHIDPSRSAEAARKLFAGVRPDTVIVCDRYIAYKRLVSLLGEPVTLAYCWVHMRRDFIECAAGQVRLAHWCQAWIERIAELYRLNEARLKHYDPGRKRQTRAFNAAQGTLKETLDGLFAEAERQLAGLDDGAREGKVLRSLLNHREGLCVFLDRPRTPLDNNLAERMLRGPVIGRRLSFGSDSQTGARFTAIMYSVLGTLSMNGIDILRWLRAWLDACAKNGGKPPDDLSPWLPWSMSEEDRQGFTAAG